MVGKHGRGRTLSYLALLLVALFGGGFLLGGAPFAAADDDPAAGYDTLAEVQFFGEAADNMAASGAWNCDTSRPWVFGPRWGGGPGTSNFDTLGTALPERADGINHAAHIVSYVGARYYELHLYSSAYGDLVIRFPFGNIQAEGGFQYPTGRYDPLGAPSLFFNGNLLKFSTGVWGGGNPREDYSGRVYVWCSINQ